MYTSSPVPVVDPNLSSISSLSPASPELRRRSIPAPIMEAEEKKTSRVEEHIIVTEAEPQLSFIERHFYRSPINDANHDQDAPIRRFSWLSRGSIISIVLLVLLIMVIVLCAVLATIFQRHHAKDPSRHPSPIRQAIFANFPDPAILQHEGTWYAYATNNAAGVLDQPLNISSQRNVTISNVQLATSQDFVTWTVQDPTNDPLPRLGAWAKYAQTEGPVTTNHSANVWAPEVLKRPSDGLFVMYYSAATKDANRSHCVGAAVSDKGPAGPYTPVDTPITCPIAQGGAIDPAAFVDVDGSIYVMWKVDGNNIGHGGSCGNAVPPLVDTPIIVQKMLADGYTPDGPPKTILDRIKGDGPLVEAPALIRSDEGIYFLFFSSGCTREASYDLKYAWAHNVTGPYTRAHPALLKTDDWDLLAPGSVGVSKAEDGHVDMAFHARVPSRTGRVRAMFTSRMVFRGKTVTLVL